jgi:hypothetical protein
MALRAALFGTTEVVPLHMSYPSRMVVGSPGKLKKLGGYRGSQNRDPGQPALSVYCDDGADLVGPLVAAVSARMMSTSRWR